MNEVLKLIIEIVATGAVGWLFIKLRVWLENQESLKSIKISKETEDFVSSLAAAALKLALNYARLGSVVNTEEIITLAKKELGRMIDNSPNKLKSADYALDTEVLKVADINEAGNITTKE